MCLSKNTFNFPKYLEQTLVTLLITFSYLHETVTHCNQVDYQDVIHNALPRYGM